MSVFLARFDHLVVDWDLNLSLAVYMAGSPYTSAELNLISSTFDTLVTNLRSFLTVSICTDVWCDRLDSVLSVCRHHITDLLRSISLAQPPVSRLLPLLHSFFAATYSLCINAYYCPLQAAQYLLSFYLFFQRCPLLISSPFCHPATCTTWSNRFARSLASLLPPRSTLLTSAVITCCKSNGSTSTLLPMARSLLLITTVLLPFHSSNHLSLCFP